MAGLIASGIKWTTDNLSSLLPSAAQASGAPNTALEDLEELGRTMERIQSVLMDARQRDVREHCEIHWLQELKQVAYDADDVVGDYDYDVLHAKIQARCGQKRKRHEKVIELSSIRVAVPVSIEIAGRVKKVNDRFEEITHVWDMLRLKQSKGPSENDCKILLGRQETGSLVQENSVYGRNEDVENVIKGLFSEAGNVREGNVRVLPVVGMAGVGKTTLAQLIYNDVRVSDNFEITGWVCVSGEFNEITLVSDIITSFTKQNCDKNKFNLLQAYLSQYVEGKRFFLVLDDVWDERHIVWEYVRNSLTKARSGVILVTTRNTQVARNMQTVPLYTLRDLKFEDCWSIFKQLVFDYEEKSVDESLIEVARKIVRKCGGLPLAVKAIGSVCRNTEYNVMKWIDILENEPWDETWTSEITPILKVSYDNLPAHLKECYALLALFPKGHVFIEEKIIKLWISLGYINSANGKRLDDIGKMYISELQGRSIIQKVDDYLACFVMHDLFHDLARQVAKNEVLRIESEMALIDEIQKEISLKFNSEARYVSIISSPNCKTIVLKDYHASQTLRLLQVSGSHGVSIEIPADMFLHLKHVRFLDFSHVSLRTLPESIGSLKQLHYLNLSYTGLKCLPHSICSLHKMQTLDLTDCRISEFPNCIGELVNLQHWNYSPIYLSYLPYGIGLLSNLETLTAFIVGDDNSKCHINELKHLLHLRGALHVMRIANVTNKSDAGTCLLKKHQFVEDLTLDWTGDGNANTQQLVNMMREYDEVVLRSLEPNTSLVKLTIKMYGGSMFPRWVGDVSFTKLVEVNLFAFLCEFLPPLGQFPSLKFLTCQGGKNVSQVGREFFGYNAAVTGFPSLESLDFYDMEKWESWSGVKEGDFPNLHSLTIFDCRELVSLPSPLSSILRKLTIAYCARLTRIPTLPSLVYLYLVGQIHENVLVHSRFPQLKTMELSSVENTEHLDINCNSFPELEELTLRGCTDLKYLVGLTSLASLKTLSIIKCPRLCLSSEQFPPSLKFCETSKGDNAKATKKDDCSTSY